jgi:hypothetical protein
MLIFATLASGSSRLLFFAGYELNKDYIATALCENKAKPVMQCNGKCYLAKKIKQEEKKEQQSPLRKQENKQEIFALPAPLDFYAGNTSKPVIHYSLVPKIGTPIGRAFSVFHPPTV